MTQQRFTRDEAHRHPTAIDLRSSYQPQECQLLGPPAPDLHRPTHESTTLHHPISAFPLPQSKEELTANNAPPYPASTSST